MLYLIQPTHVCQSAYWNALICISLCLCKHPWLDIFNQFFINLETTVTGFTPYCCQWGNVCTHWNAVFRCLQATCWNLKMWGFNLPIYLRPLLALTDITRPSCSAPVRLQANTWIPQGPGKHTHLNWVSQFVTRCDVTCFWKEQKHMKVLIGEPLVGQWV